MIANPFQKVTATQPFTPSARWFNDTIDAIADYKARKNRRTHGNAESSLDSGLCYVLNNSGSNLDRFAILGIGDPVTLPATNVDTFANAIRIKGETPSDPEHVGKFIVLQETAPIGAVAIGLVSGISIVKLNVSDEDDEFAEIDDGETDELKTGATGSAQILWKESGTGSGKWAIVRLGQPTESDHFTATVGAATQDGANKRWTYPFTEVEKTGAGYGGWTALDGGRTGTAYNRIEDINGASGLFGNGVDSANLTGTFEIQPCPEDVPVEITVVHRADDGSDEFWFSYENGVDGACS